jgi:cytochrome c oxidase subunit 2
VWFVGGLTMATVALSSCGGNSDNGPTTTLSADPQVQRGAQLAASNGCLGCHSTNGSKTSGPTFQHLAGSTVTLADGTTVVADASYLRTAITDPDADIVKGYPKGVMSSVVNNRKKLSDDEVDAIVAYIESLK